MDLTLEFRDKRSGENSEFITGRCTICNRQFNHNSHYYNLGIVRNQKLFSTYLNYLKPDVFVKSLKWDWLTEKEKSSPFCAECFTRGEKLSSLADRLEEIQDEISKFVQCVSIEIKGYRSQEKEIVGIFFVGGEAKYPREIIEAVIKEEDESPLEIFKTETVFPPSPTLSHNDFLDFPNENCVEEAEALIPAENDIFHQTENTQAEELRLTRGRSGLRLRQLTIPLTRLNFKEIKREDENCENDCGKSGGKRRRDSSDESYDGSDRDASASSSESSDDDDESPKRKVGKKENRKSDCQTEDEYYYNITIGCEYCEQAYERLGTLRKHIEKQHKSIAKIYSCNVCSWKSLLQTEYKPHLKKHEKSFTCKECEEKFSNQYSYEVHCLSHKDEIPYQCQSCRVIFSNTSPYISHVKFSACAKSWGKFNCGQCEQMFHAKYLLFLHEAVYHGNNGKKIKKSVTGQVRMYDCHVCNGIFKKTNSRKKLETHFQVHTGENPVPCDICGLCLRGTANFQLHRQTHKGKGGNLTRGEVKCQLCDAKFAVNLVGYAKGLRYHMKKVHDENAEIFPCEIEGCDRTFKIRAELNLHVKGHNRVSCDVCDKSFTSTGALNFHKKIHEETYKCETCDKAFASASQKKVHVTTVHLKLKNVICEICGNSYGTKTDYKKHLKTHSKARDFVCNVCGHTFISEVFLLNHMKIHLGVEPTPEKFPFMCDVCGKSYTTELAVKEHHKRIHSGEPAKKYVCQLCGATFNCKKMFDRHYTRKHDENPEIFKCEICGKEMKIKHEFRVHVKRHSIQLPCGICERTFKTPAQVRSHRVSHTGIFFECDKCDKKFNCKSRLKMHNAEVHEKQRNHFCDVCGKGFFKKTSYKSHLETHSQDKIHECPTCGEKFNTEYKLKDHKNRDHSDGPFDCHICGKPFLRKSTLALHIKKHYKKAAAENSFGNEKMFFPL